MERFSGYFLAAAIVSGHVLLLRCLHQSRRAKLLFIGQASLRRLPGEMPSRVPFTHLAWTVFTTLAFVAFQDPDRRPDARTSVEQFRRYFRFGYGVHLMVMGVTIDTPARYAAVMCYKITSGLLSSLVDNLYLPFYFELMASQGGEFEPRTARTLAFGHALYGMSTWVQRVCTIITTLTQADIALVGHLVVGVLNYTVALDILSRRDSLPSLK